MQQIKGYIWFSWDGSGFSVAKKLIDEGNTVIVAQIQDAKELHGDKTEEADAKKKRLSLYDGIFPKHDAKDILRKMAKMPNKEEWFVIFDLNSLWYYAQAAKKLGFTNGFFPTEEDTLFEDDREKGKNLVKEFWPDLKVAEVHEFKTVDEGVAFLEGTQDFFVLKANTEGDLTVVPKGDDPEQAKEALIGALKTNKSDYEKEGYILELKIANVIEVTPQMVFYNGKPVFTDIDIENKPIGSGSIGNMTGCASNLIIQTDMDEKINKIAFPEKVFEMAAAHDGMFVWDASLLIDEKTKDIYFGEFCPNRWGYDAFFTEIAMCESASSYFESLVAGKNPLKYKFGVAVRVFNIKKNEDTDVAVENEEGIFFYDVKKEDEHYKTVGNDWSLFVAAAGDNDLSKAVDKAYDLVGPDMFTDGYYRPKFDFNSREYQNSVPNRYEFTNGWLFDAPDWKTAKTAPLSDIFRNHAKDMTALEEQHEADKAQALKDLEAKHKKALKDKDGEFASIRKELDDILTT